MRKNRSPAPIFFPLLHHRRQVFPLPLQNCRIPENKRKKGYPPPPMPLLSSVPPCTLLNVEFAPQTRCCIEPPPSVAVLNKTRSNQMYMDVYLVAMASLAVLNACMFDVLAWKRLRKYRIDDWIRCQINTVLPITEMTIPTRFFKTLYTTIYFILRRFFDKEEGWYPLCLSGIG